MRRRGRDGKSRRGAVARRGGPGRGRGGGGRAGEEDESSEGLTAAAAADLSVDSLEESEESSVSEDTARSLAETPDEKRLRLAAEIVRRAAEEDSSSSEAERGSAHTAADPVAARLHREMRKAKGTWFSQVADKVRGVDWNAASSTSYRKHRLPPTCLALSEDDAHVYSGAKDCCLVRYDVSTGQKQVWSGHRRGKQGGSPSPGHSHHVLCVAVSADGSLVASGGLDKEVLLWDPRVGSPVERLQGHKGPVSGLAWLAGGSTLYSASHDRTVKIWNTDQRTYVDTLFGHQHDITGIVCGRKEEPITCGADKTARLWKVADENQLVYRGASQSSSLECIGLLSRDTFVTGAQDGSLAIWNTSKKKPVYVLPEAHGAGRWISSVASVPGSDLLASGSGNGHIRLWAFRRPSSRGAAPHLEPIGALPVKGWVNGICLSASGSLLVAAVGREHRLGRWWNDKSARNSIHVMPLRAQPLLEAEDDVMEDSSSSSSP